MSKQRLSAADYVRRPHPFNDFLYVLDRPIGRPANGTVCFSGYAEIGGTAVNSLSGPLSRSEILNAEGMFTVGLVDDGELIFSTDLFGLEHLYIYRGAKLELVSNRIHAVVDYLARRGIRRSLNEPYVELMMGSTHLFFQQAFASKHILEGLYIVPLDQYVVASDRGLELRRKPFWEDLFAVPAEPYSELIDEAAHSILSKVRAARKCGLFDRFSTDLSGGRDSRVIFGSLIRLGCLRDTPVRIEDIPRIPKDLDIALGLVSLF